MPDPLAAKPTIAPTDPETAARDITDAYTRISDEVHKVIVGQDQVVDELLTCIICGGHALVVRRAGAGQDTADFHAG